MRIGLSPGDRATGCGAHAVFVVVPRFNLTTLITMIETMRIANYLAPKPLFSWQVVSFDPAPILASNGMTADGVVPPEHAGVAETVFVLGSWGSEVYDNPALTAWLRRRAREGARICSVELGCYIVARAGLMGDTPATTHWSWMGGFDERFPHIELAEQLYTIEDRIMSCAGGLAGIDLMLSLIGARHGTSFAGEIADQMLHHPVRPGTMPQRRSLGQRTETMAPLVRRAMALMERNMVEPLRIPEIAAELGISQRQLERQFKANVGCTVVQFGQLLRLQRARVLLIATGLSVREIASACGFNSLSHFAGAFRSRFGRRPSDYREAWPADQPAPTWPGTLAEYLGSTQAARHTPGRQIPGRKTRGGRGA